MHNFSPFSVENYTYTIWGIVYIYKDTPAPTQNIEKAQPPQAPPPPPPAS